MYLKTTFFSPLRGAFPDKMKNEENEDSGGISETPMDKLHMGGDS